MQTAGDYPTVDCRVPAGDRAGEQSIGCWLGWCRLGLVLVHVHVPVPVQDPVQAILRLPMHTRAIFTTYQQI